MVMLGWSALQSHHQRSQLGPYVQEARSAFHEDQQQHLEPPKEKIDEELGGHHFLEPESEVDDFVHDEDHFFGADEDGYDVWEDEYPSADDWIEDYGYEHRGHASATGRVSMH